MEPDPLDQPFEMGEPPAPPAGPAPRRVGRVITQAGSIALLVALFVPWSKASRGEQPQFAWESVEGKVAAGLVAAAIVVSNTMLRVADPAGLKRRALWMLLVTGAICVVANVFLLRLYSGVKRVDGVAETDRLVGWGSPLMVAAAIVTAFGASRTFVESRRARRKGARPPKNLDAPPPPN